MKAPLADITGSSITQAVLDTIRYHDMLAAGDRVLVAVSGGADSTALLHILAALAPHLDIDIATAHLNHGLRGRTADNDAHFVSAMARRLGLPCHCEAIRLNPAEGSLEERGRRARYAFFRRLAEKNGYSKVALGHHMDDNAEAVLMHLLRGSGIRGLSGIPPVRDGWIVRPLIATPRVAILQFLQTCKIDYVEDSSNSDLRFNRNRIRHHLIPLLKDNYNPKVVATLHRTADLCRQDERLLHDFTGPLVEKAVTFTDNDAMILRIEALATASVALQRRIIRDGLRRWQGHLRRITATHIDKVVDLAKRPSIHRRLCLPNRIGVERATAHLKFTIRRGRGFTDDASVPWYCYQAPFPANGVVEVDIPEARCRLRFSCRPLPDNAVTGRPEPDIAWFELSALKFPLLVRNFKPGDRIQPLGMQGHQKIKKIFADRKIDLHRRNRIPLLANGRQILWVVGVRHGGPARPLSSGRPALKVERVNLP